MSWGKIWGEERLMMTAKYAYLLPYRLKINDEEDNIEIITQKRSFSMRNNQLFEIVQSVLLFLETHTEISQIEAHFGELITRNKLTEILTFLSERKLLFLSEQIIESPDQSLMVLLAQYTDNIEKYWSMLKNYTFCVYQDGENTATMVSTLQRLGLKCRQVEMDDISELTPQDFLIAAIDSSQLTVLDKIHFQISQRRGVLWSFVLFYGDSFMISPVLNQKGYIGYSCLKEQIQLPQGQYGLCRNMLLIYIGINDLVLEVITSLTKINIKTSYGKAIIFNSVERTLQVEKVYYLPPDRPDHETVYLKRWDDER
jgi:hypothetical protein